MLQFFFDDIKSVLHTRENSAQALELKLNLQSDDPITAQILET